MKTNSFTRLHFLAFFLALSTMFTQAQTVDKAKLDQFFDRLNEKNKAMGRLIITQNDNLIYSRTIGYSHFSGTEKKPLTEASRYRIGSVSKMFTATLVYQLVEEGKLKLDDKLSAFFPQIPNAEKITILHILAHRSGIHEIADGQGKDKQRTQAEILATIAKGGSYFEPDAKYAYSNAGYVILGYIIEKVRGKPYEKVLQEKIASKIGLKDTHLGTGFTDTSKNESYSYRYIGGSQPENETHLNTVGGAGGIISTPSDLIKFIRSLFALKLFSKSSLDRMIQIKSGMEPFTYNDKTFYGHTGGIDNFGAVLVYQPEEKLALAYTTNAKVYPVGDIINGVFDIYANKPFTIPSFESMAISTEMLDKYVGVYVLEGAPKFTITREGATLLATMGDRPPMPLAPTGENKFKIENSPVNFEFDTANKKMTLRRGADEGPGKVFTKEN
jgi:D-alanyl-D-alanine carboxypeptidase